VAMFSLNNKVIIFFKNDNETRLFGLYSIGSSLPVYVGGISNPVLSQRNFIGRIDDVRILVKKDMLNGDSTHVVPRYQDILTAYWNFNEGTGSRTYDSGGGIWATLGIGGNTASYPWWVGR